MTQLKRRAKRRWIQSYGVQIHRCYSYSPTLNYTKSHINIARSPPRIGEIPRNNTKTEKTVIAHYDIVIKTRVVFQ